MAGLRPLPGPDCASKQELRRVFNCSLFGQASREPEKQLARVLHSRAGLQAGHCCLTNRQRPYTGLHQCRRDRVQACRVP